MTSLRESPHNARLLRLPRISDSRGSLTFCQYPDNLPFAVRRIFYLYGLPPGATRGEHAHIVEEQILIAISGSMTVKTFDGKEWEEYRLDSPDTGLYLPPLLWRELHDFTPGAVCLTLSSTDFNPDDYLSPLSEFTDYLASH